jgi:hypothetical protein
MGNYDKSTRIYYASLESLDDFHTESIHVYTYYKDRNLTYPISIHSTLMHDYNRAVLYFRTKTINELLNE